MFKQIQTFGSLKKSEDEALSPHREILRYLQNDKYYGTCQEIESRLFKMRDFLKESDRIISLVPGLIEAYINTFVKVFNESLG